MDLTTQLLKQSDVRDMKLSQVPVHTSHKEHPTTDKTSRKHPSVVTSNNLYLNKGSTSAHSANAALEQGSEKCFAKSPGLPPPDGARTAPTVGNY